MNVLPGLPLGALAHAGPGLPLEPRPLWDYSDRRTRAGVKAHGNSNAQ